MAVEGGLVREIPGTGDAMELGNGRPSGGSGRGAAVARDLVSAQGRSVAAVDTTGVAAEVVYLGVQVTG